MTRTRCYRAGVLSDQNFELADVSEHLYEPDAIVWIDLCAPQMEELRVVAGELGLHELAVEDAVQGRQRPKLDRYPDHSFLSTYAITFDPVTAELEMSEVAAFLTPHALVTVRRDETFDIEAVVERWDSHGDLARYGVAFLVHGLLDFIVDGHFAAVQSLDEEIEQLEDSLFLAAGDQEAVQRRSFALRKSLVLLRRVVLPMREVVNTLL